MSGTKRNAIRRPVLQPISARAIELFRAMEKARRARARATDCRVSRHGHCETNNCSACTAWWDAHSTLCDELRLKPWEWPALPRCPFPPGSVAAKGWRPGIEQQKLWDQLNAARRAIN